MRPFIHTSALTMLLAAASAALAASAQDKPAPPPPVQGPAQAPREASPPAYEGPLLRLSELMGALHYLRGLCGAPDAPVWRQRMTALLDSEGGDDTRRSRLAGAFNRGFRTYQETYRSCNASANATIKAYLEEGRTITRDIGTRFAD
jgi:uncharacterized protein (TIGR02301 family)